MTQLHHFIKAFKVFAEDENNNAGVLVQEEEEEEEEEEADKDEEEVEFVDISSLLDEDDGFEFQLPKHQRCACHILNLIASTDASRAVSDDTTRNYTIQHLASAMHFGISGQGPQ